MFLSTLLASLVAVAFGLPQNCNTITTQVVQPTITRTYLSTPVVTVYPTTPKDLGTFTLISTVSDTKDLLTLTSTATKCDTDALP